MGSKSLARAQHACSSLTWSTWIWKKSNSQGGTCLSLDAPEELQPIAGRGLVQGARCAGSTPEQVYPRGLIPCGKMHTSNAALFSARSERVKYSKGIFANNDEARTWKYSSANI